MKKFYFFLICGLMFAVMGVNAQSTDFVITASVDFDGNYTYTGGVLRITAPYTGTIEVKMNPLATTTIPY